MAYGPALQSQASWLIFSLEAKMSRLFDPLFLSLHSGQGPGITSSMSSLSCSYRPPPEDRHGGYMQRPRVATLR